MKRFIIYFIIYIYTSLVYYYYNIIDQGVGVARRATPSGTSMATQMRDGSSPHRVLDKLSSSVLGAQPLHVQSRF